MCNEAPVLSYCERDTLTNEDEIGLTPNEIRIPGLLQQYISRCITDIPA